MIAKPAAIAGTCGYANATRAGADRADDDRPEPVEHDAAGVDLRERRPAYARSPAAPRSDARWCWRRPMTDADHRRRHPPDGGNRDQQRVAVRRWRRRSSRPPAPSRPLRRASRWFAGGRETHAASARLLGDQRGQADPARPRSRRRRGRPRPRSPAARRPKCTPTQIACSIAPSCTSSRRAWKASRSVMSSPDVEGRGEAPVAQQRPHTEPLVDPHRRAHLHHLAAPVDLEARPPGRGPRARRSPRARPARRRHRASGRR